MSVHRLCRTLGHKFQPRYSIGPPTVKAADVADAFMFSGDKLAAIEASKPKTYHGDVCTRCGAVANDPRVIYQPTELRK